MRNPYAMVQHGKHTLGWDESGHGKPALKILKISPITELCIFTASVTNSVKPIHQGNLVLDSGPLVTNPALQLLHYIRLKL